jgi:ABC-type polysaccharide/polyol phosphate transport system ATPase subunit
MTMAASRGAAADLQLVNVSKRYRIQGADRERPRGWWWRLRAPRHDFWALKDLNLEVAHSETVGVIGHNGAGKSTMLKLLSGITAPTRGEIRIRGRLAALIELGSGFHPELTGRENMYLSGGLLGMSRREISTKLDRIVDFAGIGEFLDVPVKWYSSGMYVRLGFAIAAHLDPDILLVDEVLTVGDASFQTRCYSRLHELQQAGVTIVIISHDLAAIERLCGRAALLDHGRLVKTGDPRAVIGAYQQIVEGRAPDALEGPGDTERITIVDTTLHAPGGREVLAGRTGYPLEVRIGCEAPAGFEGTVDLYFYSFHDGGLHCRCSTDTGGGAISLPPGRSRVDFVLPEISLRPGIYTLGVTATEAGAERPCAWRFGRSTLNVEEGVRMQGVFHMPYTCRLQVPAKQRGFGRPLADGAPSIATGTE